ncbi:hypothetical protein OG455_38435 [Kitasatospora sp. NBC_01287]|uniref:WXG100-like domain-containing protein n=1 Tax=Kitasatospora sp. NBC_01287 TaxID=2903573 RepID=UPI00225BC523|nr:hypothetical protein [Kitasatospora sp. NBC_01287]MCX4751314.1 hypothetical protein [Kitasatospora sp. NBC_01287]
MAVELPEPLQWVLMLLAGTRWPEADEDALREMADRWRQAAKSVEDAGHAADNAVKQALDGQQGAAAESLNTYWAQYTVGKGTADNPGYFPGLVDSCNSMGDMLEEMANSAETAKIQIIAQLAILAFDIATAEAEAPETFGISLAQIPIAIAAGREAVQALLKAFLKEVVTMAAKQAAQMAAINLLAQGIEVAQGHRKSIDLKEVGQSAEGGAVAGAAGHLIGKGVGEAGAKLGLKGAMDTLPGKMATGAGVGVATDATTQEITTGHVDGSSLLGSGLGGAGGVGAHAAAGAFRGHSGPPAPDLPHHDLPTGQTRLDSTGKPVFTKSGSPDLTDGAGAGLDGTGSGSTFRGVGHPSQDDAGTAPHGLSPFTLERDTTSPAGGEADRSGPVEPVERTAGAPRGESEPVPRSASPVRLNADRSTTPMDLSAETRSAEQRPDSPAPGTSDAPRPQAPASDTRVTDTQLTAPRAPEAPAPEAPAPEALAPEEGVRPAPGVETPREAVTPPSPVDRGEAPVAQAAPVTESPRDITSPAPAETPAQPRPDAPTPVEASTEVRPEAPTPVETSPQLRPEAPAPVETSPQLRPEAPAPLEAPAPQHFADATGAAAPRPEALAPHQDAAGVPQQVPSGVRLDDTSVPAPTRSAVAVDPSTVRLGDHVPSPSASSGPSHGDHEAQQQPLMAGAPAMSVPSSAGGGARAEDTAFATPAAAPRHDTPDTPPPPPIAPPRPTTLPGGLRPGPERPAGPRPDPARPAPAPGAGTGRSAGSGTRRTDPEPADTRPPSSTRAKWTAEGLDQGHFRTMDREQVDRLVDRLPEMTPADRARELGGLTPEQRRWFAKNPALVDRLRDELPPEEFARTAARFLVNVDPRCAQPVAAREAALVQVGRMLQDPHVAAELLKRGAGVTVVPKDLPMTDVPAFGWMRGTHADGASGDGRGWDTVRGSGGLETAVTEENLLGETTTVGSDEHYDDGYSTTTHEFAHNLHQFGLSPADRRTITEAYQSKIDTDDMTRMFGEESPIAWSDGRRELHDTDLDNYGSRDELEYFAQVSNAYLGTNHGTDPYTGEPRNNGAEWVRANEPDLVPLLERLYGKDPAAIHPEPANPVNSVREDHEVFAAVRDLLGHDPASTVPPRHEPPAAPEQHQPPATVLEHHDPAATLPPRHEPPAAPEQHEPPATVPEHQEPPAAAGPFAHDNPPPAPPLRRGGSDASMGRDSEDESDSDASMGRASDASTGRDSEGEPEGRDSDTSMGRRSDASTGRDSEGEPESDSDESMRSGSPTGPVRPPVEQRRPLPVGVRLETPPGRTGRLAGHEVRVDRIALSADRPMTRFGAKQRSHTVPWTLTRRAVGGLAGRSADDLWHELKSEVTELRQFKPRGTGAEAKDAPKVATRWDDILDRLDRLPDTPPHDQPLHEWKEQLGDLLSGYVELSQLTSFASFADGRAVGRGERSTMKGLDDAERRSAGNAASRGDDDMSADSPGSSGHQGEDPDDEPVAEDGTAELVRKKLLDLKENGSLTPADVAAAKRQLARGLLRTFPGLMTGEKGRGILKDLGFDGHDQLNVAPGSGRQPKQGFLADVTVKPGGADGSARVGRIMLSDKDRPPTQYTDGQRSHAASWSLLRGTLLSFEGRGVHELGDWLGDRFSGMESVVRDSPDRATELKAIQEAREQLGGLAFEPDHVVSEKLGDLLETFVTAHQKMPHATFADNLQGGGATSSGELDLPVTRGGSTGSGVGPKALASHYDGAAPYGMELKPLVHSYQDWKAQAEVLGPVGQEALDHLAGRSFTDKNLAPLKSMAGTMTAGTAGHYLDGLRNWDHGMSIAFKEKGERAVEHAWAEHGSAFTLRAFGTHGASKADTEQLGEWFHDVTGAARPTDQPKALAALTEYYRALAHPTSAGGAPVRPRRGQQEQVTGQAMARARQAFEGTAEDGRPDHTDFSLQLESALLGSTIPRDGDCLYHAVNVALDRTAPSHHAALELRGRVTDWVLRDANLDTVRQYAAQHGESLETVVDTLATTGNWAGNAGDLAPRIVASALGVTIVVHRPGQAAVNVPPLTPQPGRAQLIQLHLEGDHYTVHGTKRNEWEESGDESGDDGDGESDGASWDDSDGDGEIVQDHKRFKP